MIPLRTSCKWNHTVQPCYIARLPISFLLRLNNIPLYMFTTLCFPRHTKAALTAPLLSNPSPSHPSWSCSWPSFFLPDLQQFFYANICTHRICMGACVLFYIICIRQHTICCISYFSLYVFAFIQADIYGSSYAIFILRHFPFYVYILVLFTHSLIDLLDLSPVAFDGFLIL